MKRLLTVVALACAALLTGCAAVHEPVPLDASGSPGGVDASARAPQQAAAASARRPNLRSPLAEQRGAISATGYAVISVQEHSTPAQQRLMAIRASKLDAYRTLTEQVFGQQMDSTTTVADAMVLSDTFRARVQGIVHGARVVSISPVGDDTYETTLSLEAEMVNELRAYYLDHLQSQHQPVQATRPLR
jgi:outer membrane protein FlgP